MMSNSERLIRFGRTAATIGATLLGLLILTFCIGRMMPSDPVRAVVGEDADQATYEAMTQKLGLDQPIYVQFGRYVADMASGDFGVTLRTGRPVIEDIARVFPATVELATAAILIGAGLGIPLGVLAAVRRNRPADHVIRFLTLFGHSTPIFWTGMIALIIFYAYLGWFAGGGRVDDFYLDVVPPHTGFLLIDSAIEGEWDIFWNALNHLILPYGHTPFPTSAFSS